MTLFFLADSSDVVLVGLFDVVVMVCFVSFSSLCVGGKVVVVVLL